MRTSESQYEQNKRLQKSASRSCDKFDGAEEFIKEKIEEFCSNGKLSVEEVTYLFMNDYDNF